MSEENKRKETWIQNKWRPFIGWAFILIIIFDFVIAPVGWTIWHSYIDVALTRWEPLTFGAGGLFYVSLSAILGVTSWSRGKEKIHGVAGDGYPSPALMRNAVFEREENIASPADQFEDNRRREELREFDI